MKIIHVLADGTVKQDIDGHQVNTEDAKEFYEILKREISKQEKEVKK